MRMVEPEFEAEHTNHSGTKPFLAVGQDLLLSLDSFMCTVEMFDRPARPSSFMSTPLAVGSYALPPM